MGAGALGTLINCKVLSTHDRLDSLELQVITAGSRAVSACNGAHSDAGACLIMMSSLPAILFSHLNYSASIYGN